MPIPAMTRAKRREPLARAPISDLSPKDAARLLEACRRKYEPGSCCADRVCFHATQGC